MNEVPAMLESGSEGVHMTTMINMLFSPKFSNIVQWKDTHSNNRLRVVRRKGIDLLLLDRAIPRSESFSARDWKGL